MMSKGKFALAIAALAVSAAACAQQQGYVGIGVGESDTNVSGDSRKTAYKLFAGYDFNKVWGIEGGWADLGKPQYAAGEGRETAWFLAGKGTLPINDKFNVFAKLGATRNKLDLGGNNSRTDLLAGIGGEYTFNKQVGLRLEYEDFGKFGDDNNGKPRANMWTLGVTFKSLAF
jgi:OOP family OmpA-OmpF porin